MMEQALRQHISQPLNQVLGLHLEKVVYHDVCPVEYLTTNNNGTDIISHQLELVFAGGATIYLSWVNVAGWMTYSLGIAHESFCTGAERYLPPIVYWQHFIGQPLTSFEVYGHQEETWIEKGNEGEKKNTFYNEPHLVILHFATHQVGVANWYAEDNFLPRLPIGDDLWILFRPQEIAWHIKALSLDKLEA
ncbi:hypothetical protein [Hymenobacter sp. APR13]|uniref:hypothetical protein n=1 Tax=Hymenobacter sp. APR13 TaxID=1356852 RepID=UPI0004E03AAD|nr:hypothetical protein [Hymenobacter sp. APR13]AII53240.1 hypothetical protein N008_14800 [Hymenobacter sp. APR13]